MWFPKVSLITLLPTTLAEAHIKIECVQLIMPKKSLFKKE